MKRMTFMVDGDKWIMHAVKVYVSDRREYDYNHPKVAVTFRRDGVELKEGEYASEFDRIQFDVEFQRNVTKAGDMDRACNDLDLRYVETRLDWCASYGGHIDADVRIEVFNALELKRKARIASKFSERIGEVMREKNLHLIHKDECAMLVHALEGFVSIETVYNNGTAQGWMPYDEARFEIREEKREAEKKTSALIDGLRPD
jgi:hypothetical protein